MMVTLEVNQIPLSLEVDTGAAVSVISEQTYKATFPNRKLFKSDVLLRTYTGEAMSVVGEL